MRSTASTSIAARAATALAIAFLTEAAGAGAQQPIVRSPEAGAEIPWWRPTVVFEVPRAMQAARDRLRVAIDSDDVTEFVEWQGDTLRVTSPVPLQEGPHAAELRRLEADGVRALARVEFTTTPPRRHVAIDARLSDASGLEAGSAVADVITLAPHADGTLQSTGTATTFDATWNQTVLLDGGMVFESPLMFAEHSAGRLRLSGGLTDADLQADTHFVGSRTFRQVASAAYDTGRAGVLAAHTNFADGLPSSDGTAERPYWIQNLSWKLRLPGPAGAITLLAQHARGRTDAADADAFGLEAEQGTLLGAHVRLRLGAGWTAVGESMFSRDSARGSRSEPSDFAVRGEVTGKLAGQRIVVRTSRVGATYRNHADPGLQSDRQDGEVVVARQHKRFTYSARFAIAHDGLDGTVERTHQRHLALSVSATPRPTLTLGADFDRQMLERPSGDRDEARGMVRIGAGWRQLRADVHAARSTTRDSSTGRSTWTFLKAAGRAGPFRGLTLSGGGGFDRRTGPFELETSNVFLESAFALPPIASRIAFTLAGDAEERTGRHVSRRWVSGAWSRQLWTSRWNLSIWVEGRWQRLSDHVAGTRHSGAQGLVRVAWNPEWAW
ncbi:MAG: hypothetical protein AB1806_19875 [Acidobacteriota bacterium]